MGLKTTLTVTCDYSGCKTPQGTPSVIEWCKEVAERDESQLPEEAKYLVMFNLNGTLKTFCCQLHAAEFFLPPGYEAVQKKEIEFPTQGPEVQNTYIPPWKRPKPTDERNVISRSESDPVSQPDGYSGPDNGPGGPQLDNE